MAPFCRVDRRAEVCLQALLADRDEAPDGCGEMSADFFRLRAEDWCSEGAGDREAARAHDAVVAIVNQSRAKNKYRSTMAPNRFSPLDTTDSAPFSFLV